MSCGNHHDTPCSQILEVIYLYLDNEDCNMERTLVTQLLIECGPCNEEFGLEQVLKSAILRSCQPEVAPVAIYERIVAQFADIQVEITRVQKHT